MKYTNDDIIVEAKQYIANGDTNYQFYELCAYFDFPKEIYMSAEDCEIYINVAEGVQFHVKSGDYVFKDNNGIFYCRNYDAFESLFKPLIGDSFEEKKLFIS
jgi:hypothetical protein